MNFDFLRKKTKNTEGVAQEDLSFFETHNLNKKNVLLMRIAIFLLTPVLVILPFAKNHFHLFNETLTTADTSSIKNVLPVENGGKGTISLENDGKEYKIKKVVIDAGHGGHDSGCESNNGTEKKNTLNIALKLGQRIKDAFPEITIIYTRSKDEFIELHERAAIANRAKADLFISIHCNSTDAGTPLGTETYVLGMHKMEENLEVAKRENSAILLENDYEKQYDGFDPNSTEGYIIFSMYQNAYLDKSILFGKYVEESLKNNAGRRSLGVKQAGFVVLRQAAMPSVLIETGFLNHPREGEFISSNDGQETIAESILLAFKKYKKAVETKEILPETTTTANLKQNTEGVVFKIQLATSSQDMRQAPKWKAVQNLEVVKTETAYKYFKTGLSDYNEASAVLKKMRVSGFPDAFVVAYRNGKRVSFEN